MSWKLYDGDTLVGGKSTNSAAIETLASNIDLGNSDVYLIEDGTNRKLEWDFENDWPKVSD